jgi:hypothetical protein
MTPPFAKCQMNVVVPSQKERNYRVSCPVPIVLCSDRCGYRCQCWAGQGLVCPLIEEWSDEVGDGGRWTIMFSCTVLYQMSGIGGQTHTYSKRRRGSNNHGIASSLYYPSHYRCTTPGPPPPNCNRPARTLQRGTRAGFKYCLEKKHCQQCSLSASLVLANPFLVI